MTKQKLAIFLAMILIFSSFLKPGVMADEYTNYEYARSPLPFTLTKTVPGGVEKEIGDFASFTNCVTNMDINDEDSLYTIYLNQNVTQAQDDAGTDRSNNKIRLTSGPGGPYTLTMVRPTTLIHLNHDAELTIDHIILDGGGLATLTYLDKVQYENEQPPKLTLGDGAVIENFNAGLNSCVFIEEGELIIKPGASIINNHISVEDKSLIYVYQTGKLTIEGGNFEGNSSNNFGGVILSYGEVNIHDGNFINNTSTQLGGVISSYGGTLTITGGVFDNNSAESYGGAIAASIKTNIQDAVFKNNQASEGGGAIFYKNNELTIEHTEFNHNTANSGGAIFLQYGTASIQGSTFSKNTAKEDGGGIYVKPCQYENPLPNPNGYLSLTTDSQTRFTGNTAGTGKFNPPSNYADLSKLEFAENSFTGSATPYEQSLLNNYDINYHNPQSSLTFDAKGGTFADGTSMKTLYFVPGTEITIIDAPSGPDDTVFAYWKGPDGQYNPGDKYVVEGDCTFTAQWEAASTPSVPNIKACVAFDANGGTFADNTSIKTFYFDVGTDIRIIDAPTREGYTFDYWKGSKYQPGDKYTVEGDHTFTAQWKENPETSNPEPSDLPEIMLPVPTLTSHLTVSAPSVETQITGSQPDIQQVQIQSLPATGERDSLGLGLTLLSLGLAVIVIEKRRG